MELLVATIFIHAETLSTLMLVLNVAFDSIVILHLFLHIFFV